jgi:uncharacterized delta-60 repeat protein
LFVAGLALSVARAQSIYEPYACSTIAQAATFNLPTAVATDAAGNVYVADTINQTIRKIDSLGAVSILAGMTGVSGSTDATGGAARFYNPYGIAADSVGNLYVADTFNHTIRRVTPAGVVTTLAGSAGNVGSVDGPGPSALFNGPQGIAVDGAGNVYVADTGNQTMRQITAAGIVSTLAGLPGNAGNVDGTGSAARFLAPQSIGIDGSNNIYIADSGNNTIRKMTLGGVVTTFAGQAGVNGSTDGPASTALFIYPQGLTVDSSGNVFVADSGNSTVRKITPLGDVKTIAGLALNAGLVDGTGSAARFATLQGVAAGTTGKVYVADSPNNRIRVCERCAPGQLDTTFNSGPPADSPVTAIVVYPNGKILIGGGFSSYNGHAPAGGIARLNPNGSVDTTFNQGGGSGANSVVRAVLLQPDGKILIGGGFSQYNGLPRNGIARLDANGALDTNFAPATAANEHIYAIRLQANGDVVIGGVNGVARLKAVTGAFDTAFNSGGLGANGLVNAISVQSDDKIIIGGDFTTFNQIARSRIARLHANGSLDNPGFVPGLGANNRVFETALEPGPPPNKIIIGGAFSDYDNNIRHRVVRILPNGNLDTSFDANAVTGAGFGSGVYAISVLSDGNILIGGKDFINSGSNTARLLPNGTLDTSFDPAPGTGADSAILDIAVQPDGKVLIGGEFAAYNTVPHNRIARLCSSTAPAPLMRPPVIIWGRPRTGAAVTIGGFWPFVLRVEPGSPPRLRFWWR